MSGSFTRYGEPAVTTYKNNSGSYVQRGWTYNDDAFRWLSRLTTVRQTAPAYVSDYNYAYDPSGNPIKIADTPAGGSADGQCFSYDYLIQLQEAWAQPGATCGTPSAGTVGGPAKYWLTWTYDSIGNRLTQVDHSTATGDRTTTYTNAVSTSHKLTGTSTVDSAGTTAGSFSYDAAGHVQSRPAPAGGSQTLAYDNEGRLASSPDPTGTTTYVYAANGDRIIAKSAAGTTVYLPFGQEMRYTVAGGTRKATRYYSFQGVVFAQRTAAGVTWLASDAQGTSNATIAAAAGQAVTVRRQTPFGTIRGTNPLWPNEEGFLFGDNDGSGLTHPGAREYDSSIGRFVEVDPVFVGDDPQSWNGYAYADNNPIANADPSGMVIDKNVSGSTAGNMGNTSCKDSCNTPNGLGDASGASKPGGGAGHRREGDDSECYTGCRHLPATCVGGYYLNTYDAALAEKVMREYWERFDYLSCWQEGCTAFTLMRIAQDACWAVKGCDDDLLSFSFSDVVAQGAEEGLATGGEGSSAAGIHTSGAFKQPYKGGSNVEPEPPTKINLTCSRSGMSFSPDTLVLMADGSTKRIVDIKVGDKVATADPATGRPAGSHDVVAILLNYDDDLVDLSVDTAKGPQVVHTTAKHPFFVADLG